MNDLFNIDVRELLFQIERLIGKLPCAIGSTDVSCHAKIGRRVYRYFLFLLTLKMLFVLASSHILLVSRYPFLITCVYYDPKR